jgi:hypothetical protein
MEKEFKYHSGAEKSCLKGGDDEERLESAGAEPGREPPLRGDLAGFGVLERRLQDGVGPEPERVFEREVRGEGREVSGTPSAWATVAPQCAMPR